MAEQAFSTSWATKAPKTAFMGAARPRAAELSPEVPLPAVPFVLEEGAAAEPDAEPEADAEPETDAEEFADADAEAAALSDTEAIMIEDMLAMKTKDCVRTNQRNGTLTRGATRDSDGIYCMLISLLHVNQRGGSQHRPANLLTYPAKAYCDLPIVLFSGHGSYGVADEI